MIKNKVTKLVRKDANTPNYWYTLRWIDNGKCTNGGYFEANICFDSKGYPTYRECMKEAIGHKRNIERGRAEFIKETK